MLSNREAIYIMAPVLVLAAVALFLFLHEREADPSLSPGRTSEVEAPPWEEREIQVPSRRARLPSPPPEEEEKVEVQVKRIWLDEPKAPVEAPPKPPGDYLVMQRSEVVVTVGGSWRTGDDHEFAVVLRPRRGVDDRFHTRVVRASTTATNIGDLPCVNWEARIVGRESSSQVIDIEPETTNEIYLSAPFQSHRLRILATAPEEQVVKNLRLATVCPGDRNRLIELGPVEAKSGNVDLYFDDDLDGLYALADGWSPVALVAGKRDFIDSEDALGPNELAAKRQQVQITFEQRAVKVSGRVFSEGANPINGAQVVFSSGRMLSTAMSNAARNDRAGFGGVDQRTIVAICDIDGRFEFEMSDRSLGFIQARASGFESSQPISVNAQRDIPNLEIPLLKGRTLVGVAEELEYHDKKARRGARRERAYLRVDPRSWFGPLDDLFYRVAPARDGSYLVECAPIGGFAIGRFWDSGSPSAGSVWRVEIDHPVEQVVVTR